MPSVVIQMYLTFLYHLLNKKQEKGWNERKLLKLIVNYKDAEMRGAWTKIASSLPDRSVGSIHQLVRNRFHPGNYKGAWKEDEEKKLIELINEKGRKWQEIADELGIFITN